VSTSAQLDDAYDERANTSGSVPIRHCARRCPDRWAVRDDRGDRLRSLRAVAGGRTMAPMAVLADAALNERERELLDRFVAALQQAYGDDLDAIWLYGSRARGERSHDESDIDVLVVTRSDRDDEALIPTLWRVLDDMCNPRILVDPRQRSRAWVEDRRAIDSFFLRDVDRDRIVLYGGA
jgi:predicted nucleotidyltransferase